MQNVAYRTGCGRSAYALKGGFAKSTARMSLPLTVLLLLAGCSDNGPDAKLRSDTRTLHLIEAREKERTQYCVENEQDFRMGVSSSAVFDRFTLTCSSNILFVRSYLQEVCRERGKLSPDHCGLLAAPSSPRLVDTILEIAQKRERLAWQLPAVTTINGSPVAEAATTISASRGNIRVQLTLTSQAMMGQDSEDMKDARWVARILDQDLEGKLGVVLPSILVEVNDTGKIFNEIKVYLTYFKDGKLWRLGEWFPVQEGQPIYYLAIPKAAKDWKVLKKGGVLALTLEGEDPKDNFSISFSKDDQKKAISTFLKTMPNSPRVQSYMAMLNPEEPKNVIVRTISDRLILAASGFIENVSAFSGTGEDLITASSEGDISRVKALVRVGVDVDATTDSGSTSLILAASNGHLEVVQFLVESGAKINLVDQDGRTALVFASGNGRSDVVSDLLMSGAKARINHQDDNGWTALMQASSAGHQLVVKALLARGASANVQQQDGATSLIFAADHGNRKVVQLLLNAGADPFIEMEGGFSAFDAASASNHTDIAKILVDDMFGSLNSP